MEIMGYVTLQALQKGQMVPGNQAHVLIRTIVIF